MLGARSLERDSRVKETAQVTPSALHEAACAQEGTGHAEGVHRLPRLRYVGFLDPGSFCSHFKGMVEGTCVTQGSTFAALLALKRGMTHTPTDRLKSCVIPL